MWMGYIYIDRDIRQMEEDKRPKHLDKWGEDEGGWVEGNDFCGEGGRRRGGQNTVPLYL